MKRYRQIRGNKHEVRVQLREEGLKPRFQMLQKKQQDLAKRAATLNLIGWGYFFR